MSGPRRVHHPIRWRPSGVDMGGEGKGGQKWRRAVRDGFAASRYM